MRRLALSLALLSACALPGCFATPFVAMHDAMIGNISPAGQLRRQFFSKDFSLDIENIRERMEPGEPMFRPIPTHLFQRMFPVYPATLNKVTHLFQAMIMRGISFVVQGEIEEGEPVTAEQRARLKPGMSEAEVVAILGAPGRWFRRPEGSLMAYEATVGEDFSWYIGVPPLVSGMFPVPGIENLRMRWWTKTRIPYRTLIFFDENDQLLDVVFTEPKPKVEDGDE